MRRAPPSVLCHVPTPTRCTSHQPPPLASVPRQRPRFRVSSTPQPLHVVNTPSSTPRVLRIVNTPTSACRQCSDLCISSMPRLLAHPIAPRSHPPSWLLPAGFRASLSSTPSVAGRVLVSVPLSSSGSPQTMARRVSLSSASTLRLRRCRGHRTPSYVSFIFISVVLPLLTSLRCPLPCATHIASTTSPAFVPRQHLGLCRVDAMASAPRQRLRRGPILFTVD